MKFTEEIHEFQITLEEYQEINFTPIIPNSLFIPSLREHTRFKQPLMQVIFSFEDQWMKQSHQFGNSLFGIFGEMFAPVDWDAMLIRKKSEQEQSRIRITNFNDQYSLS